ncbi:MAG: hypothetical protein AAFR71_10280 [Pseudomonadota bacterium]
MDKKTDIDQVLDGVDTEKRETLKKLATAAWAIPVVTTFTLGGLGSSKGLAQTLIITPNAVTMS